MTSMFDSRVYKRRKEMPWAKMSLLAFVKEMAPNRPDRPDGQEGTDPFTNEVVLRIRYRPAMASRYWFEIEFTGPDGERHRAEAQEFDLMLWRAAEMALRTQERAEAVSKTEELVAHANPDREGHDPHPAG